MTRQVAWVFLLAALVGTGVGLASTGFRAATEALARSLASLPAGSGPGWLVPTAVTALLCGVAFLLVRRLAPEAGGSGVQEIEGALDGVRPVRWPRVLPVKFVSAVLALGSGMVLGREGPTVQIGGGVGAMVSRLARLPEEGFHVLVASGAAAGLAAAFNAPLSGVIFIIEEMRPQFRFGFLSFQSILVASLCADIATRVATGQSPVLEVTSFPAVPLRALWMFAVFGGTLGVLAVAFSRAMMWMLQMLDRFPERGRLALAVGVGGAIGLVGWANSDAVGGGYDAIGGVFAMRFAMSGLLSLFAVRFVLTLLSYGSGVAGGIFTPMLALGTLFGMAFGLGAHSVFPGLFDHPGAFAVAGMAAFFAGTVRAPITGIALTVEMTGDFALILPLLITCLASTIAAEALGGRPIYAVLLERTLGSANSTPKPAPRSGG
jgi:CIC family chloride channel protein